VNDFGKHHTTVLFITRRGSSVVRKPERLTNGLEKSLSLSPPEGGANAVPKLLHPAASFFLFPMLILILLYPLLKTPITVVVGPPPPLCEVGDALEVLAQRVKLEILKRRRRH
jgi:hypothetical protein